MKFDEFKIDGVEMKINDEYALINGTIKIMLSQISEVIINEPDWLGVGRLELKLKNSELGFNYVLYYKNKEEFEDMLKLKEKIENRYVMLPLCNIQKEFKKRQIFLIIDNIICVLYNLKWTKETVEYGRRLALLFQEGCYPS